MNHSSSFYTLKGYSLIENPQITSSMEDYLEMICRIYKEEKTIRINQLASRLHVKPSSASKMVSNLKSQELVDFERYGIITLTEKGLNYGEYLLFRHEVLHRFFCHLNQTSDELELVEKVEHFIDERTIYNMQSFLKRI